MCASGTICSAVSSFQFKLGSSRDDHRVYSIHESDARDLREAYLGALQEQSDKRLQSLSVPGTGAVWGMCFGPLLMGNTW